MQEKLSDVYKLIYHDVGRTQLRLHRDNGAMSEQSCIRLLYSNPLNLCIQKPMTTGNFGRLKMKQVLQSLKTGEIEIADIPVPLTRPGHLLIEARKSLISIGTERMLLQFGRAGWIEKAMKQPDRVRQVLQKVKTDGVMPTYNAVRSKLDQPVALGYSHIGVVREVGECVEGFQAGDRVVSNGPHADVVCVPANLCAAVPENVDDETAVFTVVGAIALQGVRLIEPTLGESIAVMGLGLIGLLSVQILRANGCRVIGFDFDERKVALAHLFGAEAHALAEGFNPVETALSFTRGYGVDGVLVAASTASNEPIRQAPQMCRPRGRVVLLGVVGLNLARDDFFKKEISFRVSCSYGPGRYDPSYEKKGFDYPIGYVRWTEQRNFEAVLQLMADRRVVTKELISDRFDITEAHQAYEKVLSGGDALGIVLQYPASAQCIDHTVQFPREPSQARKSEGAVTVGFIGSGLFATSTLIPAFAAASVRLKSIASAGGVTAFHSGRRFGFESVTTDSQTILDDAEINTVVIATQHDTHGTLVINALKAGKHVFVEKPLCITREELTEIEAAWRDHALPSGHILTVGFNRRFAPNTIRLREILKNCSGPFSFIMTVNAGAIPREHWTQDLDFGGGRIIGEGCHFIDLLRYLAGSHIVSIETTFLGGTGDQPLSSDTASISIRFSNGSIGTVHYFSQGHKSFPKERLEVFCDGKVMQLDNFRNLTLYGIPGGKGDRLMSQDKGHRGLVHAFVEAIKSGKESPTPFEELCEVTDFTFRAAMK